MVCLWSCHLHNPIQHPRNDLCNSYYLSNLRNVRHNLRKQTQPPQPQTNYLSHSQDYLAAIEVIVISSHSILLDNLFNIGNYNYNEFAFTAPNRARNENDYYHPQIIKAGYTPTIQDRDSTLEIVAVPLNHAGALSEITHNRQLQPGSRIF